MRAPAKTSQGKREARDPTVAGQGQGQSLGLIVGIGASAGGLEAFKTFFSAMPADTGMAFVLVQHLDPDHNSNLVEILRHATQMEVSLARDGALVLPNQLFIIPPDAILTIDGGRLRVLAPATTAARRASINAFLVSLAEDQGENAVAIILSGFGSDGALGVASIKEYGGLTMAQAEFDHVAKSGMPQSAVAGGFVDRILPVEMMPAALIEYMDYRAKVDAAKGSGGILAEVADHLGAICAVLNSRLGHDFSQYKTNTLMRRVQRRMQVLQIDDVTAYIDQLRDRPNEPELLFREVLIRVTRFFRDPSAFDALAEKCLPAMLARGDADAPIRVWAPGCATGEEAYSLAILIKEAMAHADRPRRVQIFATDIDDQAIELARAGIYPDTIAADMSPTLLERYFIKEDGQYRVSKDIRELCLFSVHDLVKDPPFSRLDMISCRNLLIYFGTALQDRVAAMFHYSLVPEGILFLGASEAVTAHRRLFSAFDKKHRLFTRLAGPTPAVTAPRSALSQAHRRQAPAAKTEAPESRISRIRSELAPAFVVIDRRLDVQEFSGPIARYLEPTSGAASLHLPSLINPGLRGPLRAALKTAQATQRRVVAARLAVEAVGRHELVNLVVEPVQQGHSDGLMVVAFQELGTGPAAEDADIAAASAGRPADNEELSAARERLQTMTEEMETANEELQSSNEEYQSINEELQSANEELETSKEELQSMNEELHVLNSELGSTNDTLVNLNSDLNNLIDSTSIATLFLDDQLRIRRFTPSVLNLFSVRQGDAGRPITDIVSHLARDGLEEEVRQVIRTLIPVEREIGLTTGDQCYQMRIRPYRDLNNVINGVVVTFVDITESKRHERTLAHLAALVATSEDAIVSHDRDGKILSWNTGAERIYGYSAEEALGESMAILLSAEQAARWPARLAKVFGGEMIRDVDSTRIAKAGAVIDVSMSISPIRNSAGETVAASVITRDISSRKQAEQRAGLLMGELDHRVKNILAVVSSVVTETLKTTDTPDAFATSVQGRLKAITRAHNLLTGQGSGGGALAALFETELEPFQGPERGRVTIAGLDFTLTPKAGLTLALVIHELTTNAVKYGSLSTTRGRLSVGWERGGGAAEPTLVITWAESGGPMVEEPTRTGFGSVLIDRALTYEFDATVNRAFVSAGLQCVIELPLTEEVGHFN